MQPSPSGLLPAAFPLQAYPSSSNFQSWQSYQGCSLQQYSLQQHSLGSYRSDASLAAADTPRSIDGGCGGGGGGAALERKVRGGLARASSGQRLPASLP